MCVCKHAIACACGSGDGYLDKYMLIVRCDSVDGRVAGWMHSFVDGWIFLLSFLLSFLKLFVFFSSFCLFLPVAAVSLFLS